jgi:hypothetical protein
MTPSNAKVPCVDVRHATSGDTAVDVVSAETSDSTDAQATHMTAANVAHTGTDVTSAKAPHAATKVSSASASAAPGLCARGKKAAGKHCACQNHHRSSSHDILHLIGRIVPSQDLVRHWHAQLSERQRCDTMEMRTLSWLIN